jgi:hypothetical protein
MRRYTLLLVWGLIQLLTSGSGLQGQELGLKAGISHSQAAVSGEIPWITFKPLQDLSAGFYLSLELFEGRLGVQPELNYTIRGFDAREMDQGEEISSKYKISYLECPVLIFYLFPLKGKIRPRIFGGAYLGFPLKVTEVQTAFGETSKQDMGDNLKEQDAGFVLGGSIRYRLGTFTLNLDIRYNLGLANISRSITEVAYEFQEEDTIKNRALSLTLGIGFNLRNKTSD